MRIRGLFWWSGLEGYPLRVAAFALRAFITGALLGGFVGVWIGMGLGETKAALDSGRLRVTVPRPVEPDTGLGILEESGKEASDGAHEGH